MIKGHHFEVELRAIPILVYSLVLDIHNACCPLIPSAIPTISTNRGYCSLLILVQSSIPGQPPPAISHATQLNFSGKLLELGRLRSRESVLLISCIYDALEKKPLIVSFLSHFQLIHGIDSMFNILAIVVLVETALIVRRLNDCQREFTWELNMDVGTWLVATASLAICIVPISRALCGL
jgi:hypothetical protein